MTNDRRHILPPESILAAVVAAAAGYFLIRPHAPGAAPYAAAAAAVIATLIVGYLLRDDPDDEDDDFIDPAYALPDPQDPTRCGIAAAFFTLGAGITALMFLPHDLPFVLAHLAVTAVIATEIGHAVYQVRKASSRPL